MALRISRRERRLPDAAQPMHRRDRDPSLVALERRIDRLQRVLAAEEMLGDGDRDIADRDAVLAGKLDFFWRSGRAQKLCNASSRLLLLEADEVAAAEVIDEARQPDRFDDEQQHVAFPALHHPPQRRTSLPSGKRGFVFVQVVRGNDAEHVIGLVVPLLHPADDILARSDLPIVNMRLMIERRQFLRDPMRPLLVALREADKDVRHAPPPAARDGASSYREIRSRGPPKREFQPIRFFGPGPPRSPFLRDPCLQPKSAFRAFRSSEGRALKGGKGWRAVDR